MRRHYFIWSCVLTTYIIFLSLVLFIEKALISPGKSWGKFYILERSLPPAGGRHNRAITPQFQTAKIWYQHQQGYQGTIPEIPSQEWEQDRRSQGSRVPDKSHELGPDWGKDPAGTRCSKGPCWTKEEGTSSSTTSTAGTSRETTPIRRELPGKRVDVLMQTHQDALAQEAGSQDSLQVLDPAAFQRLKREMGDGRKEEELQAAINRANVAWVKAKQTPPRSFQ